jgi:protein ImuB
LPNPVTATLARLAAICGADRVGAPAVADTHRPDAYGMKHESLIADRLSQDTNPSLAIRDSRYAISGGSAAIPLALRALRPPLAVEVFCARDRPEFVRGDGLAGRVVHAAGPWRVQGEWWSEGGYARDYYDAQLSDGCVYRLYCDLGTHSWFVDGVYD